MASTEGLVEASVEGTAEENKCTLWSMLEGTPISRFDDSLVVFGYESVSWLVLRKPI